MTDVLQVAKATNRLARFNADRPVILEEVKRRIMDAYLARAARGGDDSLEYLLNEVVFSELHRLESPSNRREERALHRWRELSNRLLRMSEREKRAALEDLVAYYGQDIVGNFDPRVYRFARDVVPRAVSLLLSPLGGVRDGMAALLDAGSQVRVQGATDKLRSLIERGTLVLAPTHSSNLDSIVLALGLVRSSLPPVTYGAGKNLFTNPFISYFMRNLGAYRVDRRLRFRLYKDVLKTYSTVILEHGYHSLFFPGGTRCRSNRIEEHLKLGLLGTALTAFQNRVASGDRDYRIFLVPVTINYRLVLEAETLIEDYLAETGQSRFIIQDDEFSRLGRLLEFGRKILAHEGSVIIRFGEPSDLFGNRVDDEGRSFDARGRAIDPAEYLFASDGQAVADEQRDAEYTRMVGQHLAASYRANTVLQSTHLLARALFDEVAVNTGTRDIYRLLRASQEALTVPVERLRAALARLIERIEAEPAHGLVGPRVREASLDETVADAVHALTSYHTRPVVAAHAGHLHVEDMKLLFYYQNRTHHIAPEGRVAPEGRA
ncbi:1-acyl-sn-glycerol-3-phosphate acyltransferase [Haliangium ochraceum]|uniref:Glycerol-3-phosphate acyltransferase n=1 Tax=Haliangium ochraceum (strain DSM 14365 / JCM 11303 / SMP-2) TaxID=502025 RepID=D0LSF3_HALO1|nr:1-acyl-sn-glycerol-3-phosphate acyltransferase [Haliangium ochraceum]ACY15652.1 phospholipid/glycerol acyltransferase [Haliangium ochraceum DSM 14365]